MKRRFWLVLTAAAVVGAATGVACDDEDGRSITVVTHDSFNMSAEVLTAFEEASGIEVKLLPRGDAGAMLTSLILTKSNPEGDVAFGVDNTFLSRALEEGVFEQYAPDGLDDVAPELKAEGDGYVTPIDYGYVNFNYDIAALEELGVPVPATLEDLTGEAYRGLVVVENPASSSPGLAFLIATVAYFGEGKYLDWWQEMRSNGLVVADSWQAAYNTNFSLKGGGQPIVLSYSTSPAFEQMFAEPPRADAPTANLLPPRGVFRQVEYAGVLAGTKHPEEAREFIDFLLSVPAQEDLPGQMAVYPVNPDAAVPDAFEKFSNVEVAVAEVSAAEIAANRQAWTDAWTRAVLR